MNPTALAFMGVRGSVDRGGRTSRGRMAVRTQPDGTIHPSLTGGAIPDDIVLFAAVPQPGMFFVNDVAGSDDTGNGSLLSPFQSIAKALDEANTEEYEDLTVVLSEGAYAGFTLSEDYPISLSLVGTTPSKTRITGAITWSSPYSVNHHLTLIQLDALSVSDITPSATLSVDLVDAELGEVSVVNTSNPGVVGLAGHVKVPLATNIGVEFLTSAAKVKYSPVDGGAWGVNPPEIVNEALDRLISGTGDAIGNIEVVSDIIDLRVDGLTTLHTVAANRRYQSQSFSLVLEQSTDLTTLPEIQFLAAGAVNPLTPVLAVPSQVAAPGDAYIVEAGSPAYAAGTEMNLKIVSAGVATALTARIILSGTNFNA